MYYVETPPVWVVLLTAAPVALLGVVWLALGMAVGVKGDSMDKPNRVAQLYGYTVCLIAIVVALVTLNGILQALFDRAAPLQSDRDYGQVSLSSFEAYQATVAGGRFGAPPPGIRDTTSEATLRERYDALVAERMASVRFRTTKALITSTILLLVSIGLFAFHWRWVRRLNGAVAALALLALVIACEGSPPPAPAPGNFGLRTNVWVPAGTAVLAREYGSGFSESTNRVIAADAAWADAWAQVYATRQPIPERPAVNFETERVVLVALGERPSSGYGIEIDSLVTFEQGTLAYSTAVRPGGDCGVLTVMTQPVHAVRISPIPPAPVEFRRIGAVHHCE